LLPNLAQEIMQSERLSLQADKLSQVRQLIVTSESKREREREREREIDR